MDKDDNRGHDIGYLRIQGQECATESQHVGYVLVYHSFLEISTLEHQNTGTIPINDIHGVVLFSEKDNDKRKRKWPKGVRAPSPPSNSTPIMIKSVAGHQSWFAGLDDVSARRFVAAVHNAVAWSDASDLEQLAHEYHVVPEGLKWNPISFSDSSEKLEEVCFGV